MKINDIINQQGIIYDRYLRSTLTLPYSGFENIKIKQNETVTNFNINSVITKLYDNFLHLYKLSYIASNIIPLTSVATIGVSGKQFSYYRELSTSTFSSFSAAKLHHIDKTDVFSVQYNPNRNQYSIFMSSGPSLLVFNSNSTFTSVVTALSTTSVFENSNIRWGKIQDFAFNTDNSLYILDLSANNIVKYDASGFLTDDNILDNTLIYQTSIGGKGSYDDSTKFNMPYSMTCYNSELYVLDSGNSCIKKYDKNLNWITTYRLFKDYLSAYPININHDNIGNMYVITNDDNMYKYANDFSSKVTIDTAPLSGDTGSVKRIIFSPTDTNVFYLFTEKYVYKRLINNPSESIGMYLLPRLRVNTDETITGFSSVPVTSLGTAYDYNFVFSNYHNIGKISIYQDNLNLTSVLTDPYFDVYPLSAVTIHPDEYLQNWVINKAISKLLINHMRLRDEITSKFLYKKDPASGDILLVGTRYLLPDEINKTFFQQDITNYIGMNELFQNNTVNRPFEYIYDIQVNMLSSLLADVQNYLDKSQIVYLN